MPEISLEKAYHSIWEELNKIKRTPIDSRELQKLKNKVISSLCISDLSVLNKSMSMAYFEYLGQIELMNLQEELYEAVTSDHILSSANQLLIEDNLNVLYYLPKENKS